MGKVTNSMFKYIIKISTEEKKKFAKNKEYERIS